jgi:ABC-type phosphate transport system substrate-binding protein
MAMTATRKRNRVSRLLVVAIPLVVVALPWSAIAQPAGSAVTVPAPNAGPNAHVTVSKTADIVNESVRVTWSGFQPSSAPVLNNGGGSYDAITENPVRVYECRGADPASSSDCYGSGGFPGMNTDPPVPPVPPFSYPGQTDSSDITPDGPANFEDTVTFGDGTGAATIQVFTQREAPSLGCNQDSPCSIVVVPNYGRDGGGGATEDRMDAPWAWDRRVVVPLSFAPLGQSCPFTDDTLAVEGTPATARLFDSWRVGACTAAKNPVSIDYTAIGEEQTRGDVAQGMTQVGLTEEPLDAADLKSADLGYAPVAVSSVVIAFQVDDQDGKEVDQMNLDPRLVAKLITASYRSGGDPNTADANPVNLFHDPEFLQLNPGVKWPSGMSGNHPILLGDLSDLTWTLTSWIAHDKAAMAFIDGKPDPWGMRVNTAYKDTPLPVASFPVLDQEQANSFVPIQGLDQVSRQLSIAQFPGAYSYVQDDGTTVVAKYPRQNPGQRQVIGILDSADAAAFQLPTASLLTSANDYVAPTPASMRTALAHMSVDDNGVTRSVDLDSTAKGVYPLTTVTDAVVPLHAPKSEAESVARFLDYAVGPGQVPGSKLGELPDGYLPLTSDLVRLNRVAKAAVLAPKPTSDPSGHDGGRSHADGSGGTPANSPHGFGPGSVPRGTQEADLGVPSVSGGTVDAGGDGATAPEVAPPSTGNATIAGLSIPIPGGRVLPGVLLGGLVLALLGPVMVAVDRRRWLLARVRR